MTKMNPTNVTELMVAAAEALMNQDADALHELKQVTSNWLQSEEELSAQHAMLDAMLEALE